MNEFDSKIIQYFLDKSKKIKNNDYLKLFDELEKKFKQKDLVCLYCYVLKTFCDVKLLDFTIRQINKKKYLDTLPSLIDFVLKPYCSSDENKNLKTENDFNNTKVLAIKILGNFKNKKALNALLFCLNDKNSNYKIRFASADAIGKIGDKNAFETLQNVVCDQNEKSTYVKESAITALGMLKDERAIDVFSSLMNTKDFFEEKFSSLKEKIIEAMSKLDVSKDKKALNILKKSLLDSSPQIRINAIEVLMNSNISENYNLIYERLKYDDDLEVKKNALVALYNISDVSVLNEVIEGAFDEELKSYAKEIIEEYEE